MKKPEYLKQNHAKKGLWAIMSPVSFEITCSMLLASISAVSLIVSLVITSFTLSSIVESKPLVLFNYTFDLLNTVLLIASLTFSAFLLRGFAFVVSHLGAFKLEQVLRTDLSAHLAKVPLGYIITNGSGALKKVLLNNVKNLHAFVADSVPMIAKSIVAPILSVSILLYIDYRLALASLIVLIIGGFIMSIAMKDSVELRKNYEKSQSDINKAVIEFAQAMPVVRTFDDGSESFKRYHHSLFGYRDSLREWITKTSLSGKVAMLILSPLPTILVVLMTGLFFLESGTLALSSLIVALFLSTGMADALMPVMWLINFIRKSQASALSIQAILAVEELKETANPKMPENSTISFEHVDFAYEGGTDNTLSDINFTVAQGSVTALVGPSGAGKSTVAKLIPRFWDVKQGAIKIGGVDIKEMSSQTLMNTVSFVFQDTFLFHDTLLNNIKMANLNASDEEVINASKAAQIHDFIISLPDGYNTKAGDRGANLSGGQKQRITIARAILRDAPILILDEATSFADPENEEEIIKALAHLMKNKTVIVIAHRLSTIKDVDQIIVFDQGKISEKGKHQTLLKHKSVYSTLWESYKKAQTWNLENKQEQSL